MLRNCFLLITCYFTKKPDSFAWVGRLLFGFLDTLLLTGFTIWATTVLFNAQSDECVRTSPRIRDWWTICVVVMAFSWLYSLIISLFCACLTPIVSCVVCCLLCVGLERTRGIQNRVPIVNGVINQLQNGQKLFTDLKDN